MSLATTGVNLQTAGLNHFSSRTPFADFDALLLVMMQHQLIRQLAKDWSQPVFNGQFPFPLALEFWGSWNDSWLKTSSFAYDADTVRGNSGFENL
jgi:hypothetical protein